jgi:F-type H+-transporting ATPase subunit delta
MSADAVVQKYSQALFEVAATGKPGVLAFEIDAVTKIFSDEKSLEFFSSPFNTTDTKTMVAKATLEGKCMPEVFNFMITLVENERIAFLSQINENFQMLIRTLSGETEGVLYSPTEPTPEFKAQVEQKLSETLKKKVKLKTQKDPNLLSGFKVTIGGWTIDDSAQFHIHKLTEDISKRGL